MFLAASASVEDAEAADDDATAALGAEEPAHDDDDLTSVANK